MGTPADQDADVQAQIHQLEKENRSLKRQLERSERIRRELEDTNEKKESILRKIIQDLHDSEASLAERQKIITELRTAQAELVQTEKMSSLGQLVAGIAHEINNPINFVWGNIQYVEEYAQDLVKFVKHYQAAYPQVPNSVLEDLPDFDLDFVIEDLPKLLNSMRMGANRIREIILSLRNFSRLDESDSKAVDIHEGMNNTLLILRHRFKATEHRPDIVITKDYADLPLIECYPGQLNQVFMNLLANAIDACEESNRGRSFQEIKSNPNHITVKTCRASANTVQILITDNGSGITPEVRGRLFEPFFTTKPIGKGTGLGLSISYQIITQKHQGRLDCQSAIAQGTTFLIEIPIHQRPVLPVGG